MATASDRAAAGVYQDTGGPLIAESLRRFGFAVDCPEVVPDGDPVEAALRAGTEAGYDVIVTTGGTCISPTDRTPEATRAVIGHEVPGIAEAIRAYGRDKVPTAALSRGIAGVAGGGTLIVNLPGSRGEGRSGRPGTAAEARGSTSCAVVTTPGRGRRGCELNGSAWPVRARSATSSSGP
ncbi:hypothetical protein SHIRM173S_11799 [Streptomyces hirsutus]